MTKTAYAFGALNTTDNPETTLSVSVVLPPSRGAVDKEASELFIRQLERNRSVRELFACRGLKLAAPPRVLLSPGASTKVSLGGQMRRKDYLLQAALGEIADELAETRAKGDSLAWSAEEQPTFTQEVRLERGQVQEFFLRVPEVPEGAAYAFRIEHKTKEAEPQRIGALNVLFVPSLDMRK